MTVPRSWKIELWDRTSVDAGAGATGAKVAKELDRGRYLMRVPLSVQLVPPIFSNL
jgi:hypothetical protein